MGHSSLWVLGKAMPAAHLQNRTVLQRKLERPKQGSAGNSCGSMGIPPAEETPFFLKDGD